ncbi:MAG: ribonuclease HI family protein [Leptospiraceae bacterium]|nr:ribonuclease HI family protein [Leptospiraceae bacterium]MCK6381031.1 ribonuclease HI family protein [Leptospiraceae bacterium]NUM41429.1 ribonuclease HI family protein [Leptospiraceae bacterium]
MITIYCDGASKGNPGPASIGVSIKSGDTEIFSISKSIGIKTNNEAEWKSLIAGLEKVIELGEKKISVFMDSELVVRQVSGIYKTKKPHLKKMKDIVDNLIIKFDSFQIQHILREKNFRADELANLALK